MLIDEESDDVLLSTLKKAKTSVFPSGTKVEMKSSLATTARQHPFSLKLKL